MLARTATLVRMARVSAFVGLSLWVFSYAWLPFALTGRKLPASDYLVVIGEVGALLAGTFALVVGLAFRGRFEPRSSDDRSSTLARTLGALLLFLVIVPNMVGFFWTTIARR